MKMTLRSVVWTRFILVAQEVRARPHAQRLCPGKTHRQVNGRAVRLRTY